MPDPVPIDPKPGVLLKKLVKYAESCTIIDDSIPPEIVCDLHLREDRTVKVDFAQGVPGAVKQFVNGCVDYVLALPDWINGTLTLDAIAAHVISTASIVYDRRMKLYAEED